MKRRKHFIERFQIHTCSRFYSDWPAITAFGSAGRHPETPDIAESGRPPCDTVCVTAPLKAEESVLRETMKVYRKKGEIPSLTGLRGIAALLVVVTHYWYWTKVTPVAALPPIDPWMATSGIGMAIFFTLSGYVISLSYSHWDWRERPAFNLTRLFFYRFARLYPAFLAFAIMTIQHSRHLPDFSDPQAQRDLLPHVLLWQTWCSTKFDGDLASDDYFHVSWSLSVECMRDLVFGLGAILVATLPKWRFKPAVLAVIFFVATWQLLQV